MDTRKIVIACQGGGIHGAFTCGVLDRILKTKEDEENAGANMRSKRRFEICGSPWWQVLPAMACLQREQATQGVSQTQ